MLVLGLVCDITLLGVLQGRVHVAECGELLLDAGTSIFAWGTRCAAPTVLSYSKLVGLIAGGQRSFSQRYVCIVPLRMY